MSLFPPSLPPSSLPPPSFASRGLTSTSLDRCSEFPIELLEASITGVKEAFANLTEMGGLDPVVKATILLSPSGFVSVPEAVAYAELKDGSLAGTHSHSHPSLSLPTSSLLLLSLSVLYGVVPK